MEAERRSSVRVPAFDIRLRICPAGLKAEDHRTESRVRNISTSGLYFRLNDRQYSLVQKRGWIKTTEIVKIVLGMPPPFSYTCCTGKIRRHIENDQGWAIEFVDPGKEEKEAIDKYIKTWQRNKRARALVVDDEESVRTAFCYVLEQGNYEVRLAPTGVKALEIVQRQPLDLVILDLKMPGLDGMETLKRIHLLDNTLPVVILTAHGVEEDFESAKKLGIAGFLRKPSGVNAALSTFKEVLGPSSDGYKPKLTHSDEV